MAQNPVLPLLFQPLSLRDLTLKNRVVIAPMMQHAAPNGLATSWHLVHLGKFALGGAGLVLTESTAVSPVGRIGKDDLGLWADEHVEALLPIVEFVHANGAAIGVQLGHAGRKAGSMPLWNGGGMPLDPASMANVDPNWRRIGPSAIAAAPGWSVPDAMDEVAINRVVEEFRAAASRADRAGFDVVELHFGHGYLVASFLSPVSNHRQDAYGGNREGRMRLALQIVAAVREVWPSTKPLFCRVSSVDGALGGWSLEDTVALAIEFKRFGVDVVDCSSGGLSDQGAALPVARGLGFQVPFAHQVRLESGVMTQAVGMIVNAQQAEDILRAGSADLIAVGREVLYDPYWVLHAQAELCPDATFQDWPLPHGVWLAKRHPTLQEALAEAGNLD
ncbi:MAG: NADH:flavin oxidoreductase/NADH oxidase [Rhodoferax sp.]|nr:NADH:flavin oxidoreductase/NADH oxidase [Rhodoferax sp.]